MNPLRRSARPLPPSESLFDPIPWVEPAELELPWWRRALSGLGLFALTLVLGIVAAIGVAVVLLGGFFLVDYLIS